MKRLKLINPQLPKPFMLIACYDVAFDIYLDLNNRLETSKRKFLNNGRAKISWQESVRNNEIQEKIKQCSEYLREMDEKIHNYIVSHNKPQRINYKKAS